MNRLGDFLIKDFVHGMLVERPMSETTFRDMLDSPMPQQEASTLLVEAAQAIRDAIKRGESRHEMASHLGSTVADGLVQASAEIETERGDLIRRALPALDDYIGDDRKAGVAHWIGLIAWSHLEQAA